MRALRVGTRASRLARWQADWARTRLARRGVESELVLVHTAGDRDRATPLYALGGRGVFIKELEDALFEDRIDIAVHSMKDLPTKLPEGLVIAAVGEREDVRDALVSRDALTLDRLPSGARVGTSSLRRRAQLLHHRGDLEMGEIRGNVDTRLAKVERGEYDAVVLAKAGLDRLGLSGRITEVLPAALCLPASGQGAIGVEARAGDGEALAAAAKLNHAETRIAVESERAILAELQGGCQAPVGVWARFEAREFVIDACVLSSDGAESLAAHRAGPAHAREELIREIVAALFGLGAGRLLGSEAPAANGGPGTP